MDSIDYVIMAIGSIITFYIELFAYAKLSNNKYDFNFKNIVIPIVGGIIVYGKTAFSKSTVSLNEFTTTYNEIIDNYYQLHILMNYFHL